MEHLDKICQPSPINVQISTRTIYLFNIYQNRMLSLVIYRVKLAKKNWISSVIFEVFFGQCVKIPSILT